MKICGICGCEIAGNASVDHVIPRAIYKWNPAHYKRLMKCIESRNNKIYAHRECNIDKGDSILNLEDLKLLFINNEQYLRLREVYGKVHNDIAHHQANKKKLYLSQCEKCFWCHEHTEFNKCTLRRIEPNKPRNWDKNACVVCPFCNIGRKTFTL